MSWSLISAGICRWYYAYICCGFIVVCKKISIAAFRCLARLNGTFLGVSFHYNPYLDVCCIHPFCRLVRSWNSSRTYFIIIVIWNISLHLSNYISVVSLYSIICLDLTRFVAQHCQNFVFWVFHQLLVQIQLSYILPWKQIQCNSKMKHASLSFLLV